MIMPEDLVYEIISKLPLKFVVQCKVLSKSFYTRISDPKFSQTFFQRQKISTLINSSYGHSWIFHKISIKSTLASHCKMTLPAMVNILATSKGLMLIDFYEAMNFCIFNPITAAYNLIPYPDDREHHRTLSEPGLAVDYPTSDRYMLVTVRKCDNFKVFSSERPGEWREFRVTVNNWANRTSLCLHRSRPVYFNDSFHWLTWDSCILVFHTKKEEATIIDLPELNIDYKNFFGREWLGVTHGLLTLVCTLGNSIDIAIYDYASNEWSVTHSMTTSFIRGLDYYNYCFPVWIDRKHVFYQVECPLAHDHESEIKRYKITPALDKISMSYMFEHDFYAFAPTLASVHTTLSHDVRGTHLSSITATLDELKRFLRDSSS